MVTMRKFTVANKQSKIKNFEVIVEKKSDKIRKY